MTLPLRPKRGGFLRPFGCGLFIRDFLLGDGPHGSIKIDPMVGATQADIFFQYKNALRRATATDRAIGAEEKIAKRQRRRINPDNIDRLTDMYLNRLPYRSTGCRYHSFVVYFSDLQKLAWVAPTGEETPSHFQERYPPGQPRKYFRITKKGRDAGEAKYNRDLPLGTLLLSSFFVDIISPKCYIIGIWAI